MDEKTLDFKTLAEQMKKLSKVYDKLIVNKDILEIWYEQFSKCREDWFCEAVTKYIGMSQYTPTPANIWEQYHKIEDDDKKKNLELWKQYNSLCSRYPGGAKADDDCKREFFRITGWDIDKAKMLVRHAEMAVKEMENGKGYIPLIEYLRGLK